mgnify:CR=1 FL=1
MLQNAKKIEIKKLKIVDFEPKVTERKGLNPCEIPPNGFQDRLVYDCFDSSPYGKQNMKLRKLRENCEMIVSQSARKSAKSPIKSRVFERLQGQEQADFKTANPFPK